MIGKIIKVFVFIAVSLSVLIVGGAYICGYKLQKTNTYNFTVNNCKGLNYGIHVYINGADVGSLTNSVFDVKTLKTKIYFNVRNDIKVTDGSYVTVDSPIFGDKSINLVICDGNELKNGSEITVKEQVTDVGGIIAKAGDILAGLNKLLAKANSEGLVGNINDTISHIKTLIEKINNKEIVNSVDDTILHVKKVLESVNGVVNDLKANPGRYLKNLL